MQPTLVLFDLDDTLLITDAKIRLRDPSTKELKHALSSAEYRDWKKAGKTADYELDFEDFQSVEKVTQSFYDAHPGPGLALLRDAVDDGEAEIGILTARSSETAVRAALPVFLKKQGIDVEIDPALIFAVRDPKYNLTGTDSELKHHLILEIINDDIFDHVFLIDDDPVHKRVIDAHCKRHKIKNVYVYSV